MTGRILKLILVSISWLQTAKREKWLGFLGDPGLLKLTFDVDDINTHILEIDDELGSPDTSTAFIMQKMNFWRGAMRQANN
jgi:hypothetical protein